MTRSRFERRATMRRRPSLLMEGMQPRDSQLLARLRTLSAHARLSGREVDVLFSAVRGLSMKETAAELSLSPKTVENYWVRIYAKTGCTSQLAVVARLWDMEAV